MKALLGIIAVVAIVAIGWFMLNGQEDAPVATAVEEAADTTTDAAEAAVESTEGVADTAADATATDTDQVEGAIEGASEAVEGVMDQANDAVEDAEDAAEGAVEAVTDATETATEAAETAIDAVADTAATAAEAPSVADALTVEGFDAATLREAVANSDLNALKRTAADTLITQAENNPEMIQSVTEQLTEMLGR